jgi:S1-C subfamily serine protease
MRALTQPGLAVLRLTMSLAALFGVCLAHNASAQPAPGSPRRTAQVEVIERCGASVVAIFTVDKQGRQNSGSGSVIHPDGYILTNDHVVQDRWGVVLIRDLPPLSYKTIGRLWEKDLALLKVDAPRPLVAVPLGRSHDVLAGEPILVGGNPGGRGLVFSAGIVSAPNLLLGASALAMTGYPDDARDRFIQFDAASNPGNSGGPLINAEGSQVGVVSGMIANEQNINFAIPIDRAHRGFPELFLPEARGNFWTGLTLDLVDSRISRVAPDSPAAQAGLQTGDRLTAVGRSPVRDAIDYYVALQGRVAEDRMPVKYLRGKNPEEAVLTLAAYPTKPGVAVDDRQAGLNYKLYRGRFARCPEFGTMTPVAQGTIATLKLSEVANLPQDDYALLLEGYIEIPADGVWSLHIGSDDGSRLYVDGALIASSDGTHPTQWSSGRQRLGKGLHPVRIEFFEATGDAELQVSLAADGSPAREEPRFFIDFEP